MEKITKSSDKVLIDPNEPLILPDGTALVGRVEWFLYALCCLDYQNLPTPMSRIEEFANALITGEIPNIQPQSRAEQFFLAILDGNISDLPQPQSRSEVLLDKLARGEFDLSDVEPIQSRYELLLAYLIKNGGIGNIDYVLYEFSEAMKTMYNTVEKPFKSLELSGNTLVNCVLEDTENDDYTSFDEDYSGTSFTINGTSEGAIKSAILSGQTLVNLANYELSTSSSEIACRQDTSLQKNNTTYTLFNFTDKIIAFNTYTTSSWRGFENVGANSKRILTLNNFTIREIIGRKTDGWDKTTETEKFLKGYMIIEGDYTNVDIPYFEGMQSVKNSQTLVNVVSSCEFGGDSMLYESRFYERPFNTGETFTIFVVNPNVTTIKVGLHNATDDVWQGEIEYNVSDNKKIVYTVPTGNTLCKYVGVRVNTELDSTGFENSLVIMSGDKSNLEIENYFEGMQSVKMPMLTTTGKNLLNLSPDALERITINGSAGVITESNARCTTKYIKATPKDDLFLKRFNTNYKVAVRYYYYDMLVNRTFNGNGNFISDGNLKVNSGDYYNQIRLIFAKSDDSEITPQEVSSQQIMLTSSQNDVFEPYKSNILTVNEEVELRGIGDVQDTLNCLTGEIIESIGEGVLNGSEEWIFNTPKEQPNHWCFHNDQNLAGEKLLISDRFPQSDIDGDRESIRGGGNYIFVYISKEKVDGNINSFKQWLSQNPIKYQYTKSEESIKTVDLNVVDQNNTKIDKIHVFDEVTHVNASSDELTPTVNIGKSVSYPTIIKPNTKYTVDLKRNDKPLTVNLGGTEVTFVDGETRKTITTPSTLTNDKLSYYGVGAKCNEIMLIEGEIERNVDYFTGMQSVVMQNQMPILSTVGKNLFNFDDYEWKRGGLNDGGNQGSTPSYSSFINVNKVPIEKIFMDINKEVYLTCKMSSNNGWVQVFFYDKNGKVCGRNLNHGQQAYLPITLKVPKNAKFFRMQLATDDISSIVATYNRADCVPYVPYKSSILSCNEEVELRGIGDVKDELDCLTGEMTQRIEEVTFDGSDDEGWNQFDNSAIQEKTCLFSFYGGLPTVPNEYLKALSDKYIIKKGYGTLLDTDEEMVHIYADRAVYFRILKSKLSSPNVIGFKEWLSQNPLTIQYQLATESIKTVDLNVVDQDGNTIPKIKSYNGVTHLEVTVPKQSLLPNVSAEVATDNSKDMSSLTTKHQEISETQSAIQDSIQFQSDEIDTALMATTEIFESILE